MSEVSVEQAQRELGALVQAAIRGETVLIASDSSHAVRLVPVPRGEVHREFGSARGRVVVAPDFDAPLEDLREYQ